jgi:hypothetical protein
MTWQGMGWDSRENIKLPKGIKRLMSGESGMRQRLVRALKPLHACSVENICCEGMPDVCYIGGWIECKSVYRWPKDKERPLRKGVDTKAFTPLQRLWLRNHVQKGGVAHVMMRVTQTWYLLPALWAVQRLGAANKTEIEEHAVWKCGGKGWKDEDLLEVIRRESKAPVS